MSRPPFVLCMERYMRKVPWVNYPVDFACQLPKDHDGPHSWQPLKDSDELATAPLLDPKGGAVGGLEINQLLTDLWEGDFDPYLENILTVAHERKKTLRGVRTFEQPRPQPRRER